MAQNNYIRTDGWNLKSRRLKIAVAQSGMLAVNTAVDVMNAEIAKNLKGPGYGMKTTDSGAQVPNYPEGGGQRGQMPIPRITGNLAKSTKTRRMSSLLQVIYQDLNVASYAKVVHEGIAGTKRTPRRYITDPVRLKKGALKAMMKKQVLSAMHKVGR